MTNMTKLLPIILSMIFLVGCSVGKTQDPALPAGKIRTRVGHEDAKTKHTPIKIRPSSQDTKSVSCENYLKQKIKREKSDSSRIKRINVIETDDMPLSPELRKWLDTKDLNELVAFELLHGERKVFVLSSFNIRATGKASNFLNWYVDLGNESIEFLSLSKSPELIFWDKNGVLRYFTIGYGEKFLENKDWENVTLDLKQYRVGPEGKSDLIGEELDVICE